MKRGDGGGDGDLDRFGSGDDSLGQLGLHQSAFSLQVWTINSRLILC